MEMVEVTARNRGWGSEERPTIREIAGGPYGSYGSS